MKLRVNIASGYDIVIEKEVLRNVDKYVNLSRKVLVITDENIPEIYSKFVTTKAKLGFIYKIKAGEQSKTISEYEKILSFMLENNFSRSDLVVAVGGGVVGDLAGFVAASYKRGIEFVNIPTSTLSMVDSSIGGKVAVNLNKVKNVVGFFYQPSIVLIDLKVLKTLPKRHYYNGLVEALKIGLIQDPRIVSLFDDIDGNLERIIELSLDAKRKIVEIDEKETGLRKILNFGHTIGHGIESTHFDTLYHGECVALGMLYFIKDQALKLRVKKILSLKMNINLDIKLNIDEVFNIILNDKKISDDTLTIISLPSLGHYAIEDIKIGKIKEILKGE